MMTDRMKPDDPSSAPAVMSILFSSTNPIATADSPAYEFRSEMTVGMSAPPIGMISSTPKTSDSTMIAANAGQYAGIDREIDARRDRQREQRQIDEVLVAIGDRPRRDRSPAACPPP